MVQEEQIKEVIHVDLIDTPHIRVEHNSVEKLKKEYDRYLETNNSGKGEILSHMFKMKNRFECAFILYQPEDVPNQFHFAQD